MLFVIWKDLAQHSPIKNCVFNHLCYEEILAYYTLENKSNKTREYQPDKLDDNLIKNEQ